MTRRSLFGLPLALLALTAADAFAQAQGTIRGVVVNGMDGQPLKGATIKAGGATTTSANGGLFALKVKPGTYDIEVSMKGYTPDKQKVTVAPGATKDVSAVLIKQ